MRISKTYRYTYSQIASKNSIIKDIWIFILCISQAVFYPLTRVHYTIIIIRHCKRKLLPKGIFLQIHSIKLMNKIATVTTPVWCCRQWNFDQATYGVLAYYGTSKATLLIIKSIISGFCSYQLQINYERELYWFENEISDYTYRFWITKCFLRQ